MDAKAVFAMFHFVTRLPPVIKSMRSKRAMIVPQCPGHYVYPFPTQLVLERVPTKIFVNLIGFS